MTKDDLIIDILEKIHNKLENTNHTLTEMKVEQARQNLIVEQHEARSTASEKRLELLEKDAQMFRGFIKYASLVGGAILFLIKFIPFLLHLLG